MDEDLKALLEDQIGSLERRIERVIAQDETSAARAKLLRSIPGIGPVSAAMLIAEMPEPDRLTAGEVAAMTGLAPCHMTAGPCEGGVQSPEDGDLCDMCSIKLHLPPPVTTQF